MFGLTLLLLAFDVHISGLGFEKITTAVSQDYS